MNTNLANLFKVIQKNDGLNRAFIVYLLQNNLVIQSHNGD